MKTYECCPAFGWGVNGMYSSAIRRKLHELGLVNEEPINFPKLHILVTPYPIKVTGDAAAVDEFEKYMKEMGHDDRV